MVGLCLVAVFAIAAVTATSASAKTPEWGKCVAKAGGKYVDGGCQTKGKGGSFEWEKGSKLPNVAFTGHSVGGGGVLTTGLGVCSGGTYKKMRVPRKKCEEGGGEPFNPSGKLKVECETETNTGETVGKNKVANVAVTFTGCKALGSFPCTGPGAAEGEVKTYPLKGELGYINKAAKEVGLRLTPAKAKGHFAEFECPAINDKIVVGVGNSKEGAFYEPESKGGNDAIISPITPVNTMTGEFTQVYTQNEAGANQPENFEGKPRSDLEDYLESTTLAGQSTSWVSAGEEVTNVTIPSEEGEIKA